VVGGGVGREVSDPNFGVLKTEVLVEASCGPLGVLEVVVDELGLRVDPGSAGAVPVETNLAERGHCELVCNGLEDAARDGYVLLRRGLDGV